MKRRKLLSLATIGGLGLALGSHRYLANGAGAKFFLIGKSDWTVYSVFYLNFAVVEAYSDRLEAFGMGTNGKVFDRGEIAYM